MNFISKIKENRTERIAQEIRETLQERGIECEVEHVAEFSRVYLKCQTPIVRNMYAHYDIKIVDLFKQKTLPSIKWLVKLDDYIVCFDATTSEILQLAKGNIDIGTNYK